MIDDGSALVSGKQKTVTRDNEERNISPEGAIVNRNCLSQAGGGIMSAPVLTKDDFQLGASLLSQLLKKVDIRVKGNVVEMTQIFELPTPEVAKRFAETLAKQFRGE